jgi:hypothetical protein
VVVAVRSVIPLAAVVRPIFPGVAVADVTGNDERAAHARRWSAGGVPPMHDARTTVAGRVLPMLVHARAMFCVATAFCVARTCRRGRAKQ